MDITALLMYVLLPAAGWLLRHATLPTPAKPGFVEQLLTTLVKLATLAPDPVAPSSAPASPPTPSGGLLSVLLGAIAGRIRGQSATTPPTAAPPKA